MTTQLTFTCSKITIKLQERRQSRHSGVFIINIPLFFSVSKVDYQKINVKWQEVSKGSLSNFASNIKRIQAN